MGGAPRVGQPRAVAGRHTRHVGMDDPRAARPGSPLRVPDHGRQQGVYGAGGLVAGAGDRSQHGDLQLHGLDPAAVAASARPGIAGRPHLAHQRPQARLCRSRHERHHLQRSQDRYDGWNLPFPGVRAFPEERLRLFERLRPLAIRGGQKTERNDPGTSRAGHGLERVGRLFSRTRRSPGSRAADHPRRRPARGSGSGRCQLRVQPKAFRRARQRRRPADSDRQPALHSCGGHAA